MTANYKCKARCGVSEAAPRAKERGAMLLFVIVGRVLQAGCACVCVCVGCAALKDKRAGTA